MRIQWETPFGELPFAVGVLANLSGMRSPHLPALEQRPFQKLTRETFAAVLHEAAPRFTARVADKLRDDGNSQLAVDLFFRSMADFGPAGVMQQLPFYREILARKGELRPDEQADLDRRLSEQLVTILHHPEFRAVERTWRGLEYLVQQLPADAPAEIRVFNVDRAALAAEFANPDDFDQTILFERIVGDAYSSKGQVPFSLLIADFAFGKLLNDDLPILRGLARIAEFALAPCLATAAPELFGIGSFAAWGKIASPSKLFEGVQYAGWKALREAPESRYLAITAPGVLGRAHYDPLFHPTEGFDFDEGIRGTDEMNHLWMSASWPLTGRILAAYARDGWFGQCVGSAGGAVDDLPALLGRDGKRYLEVDAPAASEADWAKYGIAVISAPGGQPAFRSAPSCHKPPLFHDAQVHAYAQAGAKLPNLLSFSRVGILAKFLAAQTAGKFTSAPGLQAYLQDQLKALTQGDQPVAESLQIEVKPVPKTPLFDAVIAMKSSHQLAEPLFLKFTTEVAMR